MLYITNYPMETLPKWTAMHTILHHILRKNFSFRKHYSILFGMQFVLSVCLTKIYVNVARFVQKDISLRNTL